ncbi:MAG: threonylcarbamoyl-AMP synthase [Dehalococcoidia bacterium]|nr:MAG: threonylcarbamoyl-AMP synthase [Dehalococcoidia bacterium]
MKDSISSTLIEQVKKAAAVLRDGGIVAYPTDTIYGLGADIYNDIAVMKVFAVKNRPLSLPLPVLIDDISQLANLVSGQTAFSLALANKFWPGALTIIFNKAPQFEGPLLAGSNKIGVRIPDHEVTRLLIRELGHPITGTSANLHTGEITLTADEVRRQMGSQVDFIIDAGRCPGGKESTIVDITAGPPRILRHGAVPDDAVLAEYYEKGGKR